LPTKRKLRTLHEDSHQSRPGLRCMRRIRCTPPTGSSIAPLFLTSCELKKSAGVNNNHKFEDGGRLFFADKHHIPVLKVEPQAGRLGNAPSTSLAINLLKYQFHSNVRITQRRAFAWSVPCYQW
jgi:hypothetical protein